MMFVKIKNYKDDVILVNVDNVSRVTTFKNTKGIFTEVHYIDGTYSLTNYTTNELYSIFNKHVDK